MTSAGRFHPDFPATSGFSNLVQGRSTEVGVALTWFLSEGGLRKETSMEATKRLDNEQSELRTKLEAATEKAKVLYQKLQDKTAAAAKAADETVREHPYEAIGIAFGLGVLIGVLVVRSRRSGD
jgi:ElaB/YqjD/DUF883 family membrane-anchored ribosome-binding protein